MSFSIGASGTQLTVNGKTKADFKILFDTFKATFVNPGSLKYDDNNKTLQTALNCGDTIKDGTNQAIISQLGLFGTSETGIRFTLDQLKSFVKTVEDNGIQKGLCKHKKFVRNKASVISKITKEHIETPYEIAFDAATGIQQFFVPGVQIRVFESIGKYLDPSSTRDSDFIFPAAGNKIEISADVFRRLGYDGDCKLSAIANSKDNYKYDLKIYGQDFKKDNNKARNADSIRLEICGGNAQKKQKLTQGITTAMKIAIIIAKGWGDKLQVFLAFIYKLTNEAPPGITVAVATCDEIVYNLCCYFGVTCILTSTGVGILEGDTKIQKINKILHYEPEGSDPVEFLKNLTTNFHKTKLEILKGYDDFIELITRLNQTPSEQLSVNGTTTTYSFTAEYYQCILYDLQEIKDQIDALQIGQDIEAANASLKELKMFSVNSFIKEFPRGEFRLAAASTNYNNHPTGKNKNVFLSNPNVTKRPLNNQSFMSIGTRYFSRIQGGSTINNEQTQIGGTIQDKYYIYFMNDYVGGRTKGFLVKVDDSDKDFDVKSRNVDFGIPLPNQLDESFSVSHTDILTPIMDTETDPGQPDSSLIDEKEFDAIANLYKELKYLFNKYYPLYKQQALSYIPEYFDNNPGFGTSTFYYYWSEMLLRLECDPDYSTNKLEFYTQLIMSDLLGQVKETYTFIQAQPKTVGTNRDRKQFQEESGSGSRNLFLDYGGKKSKKQTRKYVEKTNKKQKYRIDQNQKKSKTKKSKTRKYYKNRLS
jgi:hypothetical protein